VNGSPNKGSPPPRKLGPGHTPAATKGGGLGMGLIGIPQRHNMRADTNRTLPVQGDESPEPDNA
jgi:hypothetical protein